jgi:hypothetical protein
METAPNALDRSKIVSDFQYIYPLWSLNKINKANFYRDYNIYYNHVNINILINNVQALVHNQFTFVAAFCPQKLLEN